MRTNIELDDELLRTAFSYTAVKTKRELVQLALQEFVDQHRRRDLRDLRGCGGIAAEYDHKAARERGGTG